MPLMTSQILILANFTKTQNSRYRKSITLWQKIVGELTVKPCYCPSGATARYPMQVYLCHNKVGLLNFKKCMKI